MTINRRRAPSSRISSEKKIAGHNNEDIFASLIGGKVIKGTQKGDIIDKNNKLHSVKSGKKWQIFLYNYKRICKTSYLNILKDCQDSFPQNYKIYETDREKCISYKENYIKKNGREKAKSLSNEEVSENIGDNLYISSKYSLKENTSKIVKLLNDKKILRNFFKEALFNNDEVDYLSIKDNQNNLHNIYRIFDKDDILDKLINNTFPSISKPGKVPEDFNVEGQKVLFKYNLGLEKPKNIIEIEVRNESEIKYRLIRFNMYSKDMLNLLKNLHHKKIGKEIILYGKAISNFNI